MADFKNIPWGYKMYKEEGVLVENTKVVYKDSMNRISYSELHDMIDSTDFCSLLEDLDAKTGMTRQMLNTTIAHTMHCAINFCYWLRKANGGMTLHKSKYYGAPKAIKGKIQQHYPTIKYTRTIFGNVLGMLDEMGFIEDHTITPFVSQWDTTVKNPDMWEKVDVEINFRRLIQETSVGLF